MKLKDSFLRYNHISWSEIAWGKQFLKVHFQEYQNQAPPQEDRK